MTQLRKPAHKILDLKSISGNSKNSESPFSLHSSPPPLPHSPDVVLSYQVHINADIAMLPASKEVFYNLETCILCLQNILPTFLDSEKMYWIKTLVPHICWGWARLIYHCLDSSIIIYSSLNWVWNGITLIWVILILH